jgi:hypothetical protein
MRGSGTAGNTNPLNPFPRKINIVAAASQLAPDG